VGARKRAVLCERLPSAQTSLGVYNRKDITGYISSKKYQYKVARRMENEKAQYDVFMTFSTAPSDN
jgi:hypothetical protein